jgi:hypothetical protein
MLRNRLYAIAAVAVVLLAAAAPLTAQPLNWSLNAGDREEVETSESLSTWDEEIINLTVADPGVLMIDGEDLKAVLVSGSEDLCGGGSRDLPSGSAVTEGRAALPLRAGDYELKLVPYGTTWVDYRLRADLADVCAGESGDDHGDTPLCSSELCLSTSTNGSIGSYAEPDYDVFSFVVASYASRTIESSGSTDVRGELFDEQGKRWAEDDDSALDGVNFKLIETLPAGRYFVRVEGEASATGSYSLTVQ